MYFPLHNYNVAAFLSLWCCVKWLFSKFCIYCKIITFFSIICFKISWKDLNELKTSLTDYFHFPLWLWRDGFDFPFHASQKFNPKKILPLHWIFMSDCPFLHKYTILSMGSNDFFGMQNYKFIVSSTEDSIHSSSSCISTETSHSSPPAWQKECNR